MRVADEGLGVTYIVTAGRCALNDDDLCGH